ncbi:hypothetical protein CT0861_09514, partial [Colletotrichum tofieldiae]
LSKTVGKDNILVRVAQSRPTFEPLGYNTICATTSSIAMMGVAAIEPMIFPGVLKRGLQINVALPICEGELSSLERLWPANALSVQEHRQRHQHSNTLDWRAAFGILSRSIWLSVGPFGRRTAGQAWRRLLSKTSLSHCSELSGDDRL